MYAPRVLRFTLLCAVILTAACTDSASIMAPAQPMDVAATDGEAALAVSTWPHSLIAEFETVLTASVPVKGGGIASVEWQFADGTVARGTKVRHTFASQGTTTVLVTATMQNGSVVQKRVSYSVTPGIQALGTVLTGVVPGGLHTCAIDVTSSLYCWGYNGNGTIGDGTKQHRYSPVRVGAGLAFEQVATGVGHSCGITGTGAVYCWGKNESGQLGDGTTIDRAVPTQVLGGLAFGSIDVGNSHSCALTLTGAAYCWGSDSLGQLGDGAPAAQQLQPVAVLGGLTFSVIRAGYTHSCALQQTTGLAYCWGSNSTGQIGNGTGGNAATDRVTSPVAVSGGNAYAQIDVGSSHTCGLLTSTNAQNKMWCWGWNGNGQLGTTTTELCRGTVACARTPQKLPSSIKLVAITAGSRHSCGITAAGDAYCWGGNASGELGDGTTTDRSAPAIISGVQFKSIRAGRYFTCGVLLDNTARCWGYNYFGMLGLGDNVSRLTATAVPGLSF
ncbi:MAG TPA: PKD domain-containing protein [Gemmatimonadaceae bacterium]|nr:PKD domain-containing protein [Gemmatimonadaceae bacterium]